MNSKDELYYSAIDLLHRLIRTPSISREEDAAAQIICETLQKNRFTPYRAGNNVWTFAREFDSEKPTVLLNSHIDTVKPTDSWSRPPFVPIEEDNRLYGLGSNDAGASVVSLLSAFIHLSETEQPYNLVFLASAEEEVSGQNGIVKALEQLPTIDFAVVGEPTGMQPAVCEKGLLVLDCSTYGKSGQRLVQSHRNDRSPTNIRVSARFRFIGKSKTDCHPNSGRNTTQRYPRPLRFCSRCTHQRPLHQCRSRRDSQIPFPRSGNHASLPTAQFIGNFHAAPVCSQSTPCRI